MARKPIGFSAEIYRVGMNFCIDVPPTLTSQCRTRRYARVRGTLNGRALEATLTPRGEGRHRMFVGGTTRKAADVKEGDVVRLSLSHNPDPEKLPIPADLSDALQRAKIPLRILDKQPPGRRREILVWLSKAKRVETRAERIGRIVDLMGNYSRRRQQPVKEC